MGVAGGLYYLGQVLTYVIHVLGVRRERSELCSRWNTGGETVLYLGEAVSGGIHVLVLCENLTWLCQHVLSHGGMTGVRGSDKQTSSSS